MIQAGGKKIWLLWEPEKDTAPGTRGRQRDALLYTKWATSKQDIIAILPGEVRPGSDGLPRGHRGGEISPTTYWS